MTPSVQEEHVEQAAIDLFRSLGWAAANGMDETFGESGTLGREHKGEVVLTERLRASLVKLNPGLPASGVDQAIEALTRDRSALTLVTANREIYGLVQNGVKVRVPGANDDDGDEDRTVRIIDWDQPEKNDFFVAQQLWVQGQIYQRRADLVGFVNGLQDLRGLQGCHRGARASARAGLRPPEAALA